MEWWKSRRKEDQKYGNRPETRRLRASANGLVRLNRQLYGRNGFSVSRSRWHTRVAYRPLKTPEAPTRAGKEMAIRCFFFSRADLLSRKIANYLSHYASIHMRAKCQVSQGGGNNQTSWLRENLPSIKSVTKKNRPTALNDGGGSAKEKMVTDLPVCVGWIQCTSWSLAPRRHPLQQVITKHFRVLWQQKWQNGRSCCYYLC